MNLPPLTENRSRSVTSNTVMSLSPFASRRQRFRRTPAALFFCLVASLSVFACSIPGRTNPRDPQPRATPADEPRTRQGPTLERAIEVVQSHSGVYLYTYAETMEQIDPRKDYSQKYRVYGNEVITALRKLVAENREYSPEFKARCLPMWDYGLEFRGEKENAMFLFSFRCNTIRYVEGNLFKDFTPQRTDFFKIFRYEINPDTASLLEKK